MRCDVIAQGIIDACRELKMKIPIVVRLQGTRVDEARKMIKASELKLMSQDDFDTAALLSVQLAKIVKEANEAGVSVDFRAD